MENNFQIRHGGRTICFHTIDELLKDEVFVGWSGESKFHQYSIHEEEAKEYALIWEGEGEDGRYNWRVLGWFDHKPDFPLWNHPRS
jgi:hypothetical protein